MRTVKSVKTLARTVTSLAWALLLAIALALGVTRAASAQTGAAGQPNDPVAVVDAFHAAGDDIEAALALLTDDVVIELVPPPPNTPGKWVGKKEARAFFEWKNANHQRRVRSGNALVEGNKVEGLIAVDFDTFARWGLAAVGHRFEAEVADGKLKSYRGQITPEEGQRVAAARLAFEQAQASPAGMPRTGAPLALPIIVALGMIMLAAGGALRRRTR